MFRQKVLPVRSSQVRGRNRKVTGGQREEVKGREVERSEVGKWGALVGARAVCILSCEPGPFCVQQGGSGV